MLVGKLPQGLIEGIGRGAVVGLAVFLTEEPDNGACIRNLAGVVADAEADAVEPIVEIMAVGGKEPDVVDGKVGVQLGMKGEAPRYLEGRHAYRETAVEVL